LKFISFSVTLSGGGRRALVLSHFTALIVTTVGQ